MKLFFLPVLLLVAMGAQAQDEAFLSCADIGDRTERLQCLEDALDDAVEKRQAGASVDEGETTAAVDDFGADEDVAATGAGQTQTDDGDAGKGSFFRLPNIGKLFGRDADDEDAGDSREGAGAQDNDVAAGAKDRRSGEAVATSPAGDDRVGEFGRQGRVVVNDSGEDELHDTIAELLMAKPNQWLIRLASGQVWRQTTPKRLNLREGDEVRIYPSHWGNNYRLEAGRLNGYIQIVRVE